MERAGKIRKAEVVEPTLRQKLEAHWETRDRIFSPPPSTANKLGVAYVLAFSTSLMYSTLWLLLPHLNAEADRGEGGVWARIPPLGQKVIVWWIYVCMYVYCTCYAPI